MRVISRKPFSDAVRKYPNQAAAINALYKSLKNAHFYGPDKLKALYPSLDNFRYRHKWWVINIGGNNLRLIAFMDFIHDVMYVKHIVSHAEYDKLCKKYAKEAE